MFSVVALAGDGMDAVVGKPSTSQPRKARKEHLDSKEFDICVWGGANVSRAECGTVLYLHIYVYHGENK